MNTRLKKFLAVSNAILFLFFTQSFYATTLNQSVLNVVDTNPDPTIFEANLTADEQDVTIDGTTVHAIIYKDDNRPGGYAAVEPNGIPVPQIVINVGDEVIVTLTNEIDDPCAAVACNTSIHWHGLELDNDSDGTGVTQNRLTHGETYTYRFYAPRPGVFWFHPHMLPGPQTFAGTYGIFIVRDPNETTLQADGKLPPLANTHSLVLSDIEFDADGDVGYLLGDVDATPWATIKDGCDGGGAQCGAIKDAETILVNGQDPTATVPTIKAKSGSGVRLQLANVSTFRYFRLGVSNNGADNNLYRVGGEGGVLEHARREGGTLGIWDTKYDKGDILLSASQRADVVVVPTGNNGDIVSISNLEFERGGPVGTSANTGEILRIEIDNTIVDDAFTISDGSELLGFDGINDLKLEAINDFYIPPVANPDNPGNGAGMVDQNIILAGINAGNLGINGVKGHFETSGTDYTQVPYQGASRYAKTGDLLEFSVSNHTNQHHPFHHHGFSFQPVKLYDNGADKNDLSDDVLLYEYDYDEFVDVIDIENGQRLVIRISLDDRPRITDNRQEAAAPAPNQFFLSGGAAGRWVFHCHLFLHAAIGMISELVVVDTDRDGDGFDTSQDCNDFDPAINPDVLEVCDDGIDNDCNGIVDTDCNHPPVADAGPDQSVECASPDGTLLVMDGTGSFDEDFDPITYVWSALGITFDDPSSVTPSALFPLGDTTVSLTVSDGALDDSDEMLAQIVDTTSPITTVGLDTDTLWTPNHKLVDIQATVTVTDTCDADPSFVLTSITSSEDDNATGDGNTTDDIAGHDVGTADTVFQLRAERDGKQDGRTYTITYTGSDATGNESDDTALVVVPHNQ